MIRSVLEQSVRRSSPSEIVSEYLNAEFREWTVEAAFIHLQVAGSAGFHQCVVNPERQDPRLGRAFHRFLKRLKETEDLQVLCPYPWRYFTGKTAGGVLVHVRFRFQRVAAINTAGDFASPCYVQSPDAEWAAA